MTMRLRWLLAVTVFGLCACAGRPPLGPGGAALSSADYGAPPPDTEAVIRSHLRDKLNDPYAAQVEPVAGPAQLFVKSSLLSPATYGWAMCFRVNAKNLIGSYRGFRLHAIIWRDGSVRRAFGELQDYVVDSAVAKDVCNAIGAGL